MSIINLPVSLGEALDKLTILDIKKEKIKDGRLKDVEKEYDLLNNKLKGYKNKFKFYYNILKKINLDIWEMQDDFRYNNGEKNKLCLKIIDENDRRFRVKKKINDLTNSSLKEQKGYKPKKAFVYTHQGLGDHITSIGMIRYLSTCYDEVLIVCRYNNSENLELFFNDDESIKFFKINGNRELSPTYEFNKIKFNKITEGYDKFLVGGVVKKKIYQIPYCFYDHVNLDRSYFWDYFYIPTTNKSLELYNEIKDNKYLFMHNTASNGLVFSIQYVENKLNINKNNILFINPCINCYDKDDKFYKIAQKFIGFRLIHYCEIIKNAEYNICSDSSFFCLAMNLDIKNNNNYYHSRQNRSYEHIYDKNFKKNKNKKRFKKI